MNHVNLPQIFYVYVDNNDLGVGMPPGFSKGILHGIYAREGQAILTHILLESGAHWSGIPLYNLYLNNPDEESGSLHIGVTSLQPWGGMGSDLKVSKLTYLEGLRLKPRFIEIEGRHTGIIIDWADGFSIHPQEHKPLSLIVLDNGQFAMLPNNYFLLSDPHFTKPSDLTRFYRRGETVYWER